MREYVICVCFAILFCVGVSILVPSKKYSGIIKIVCGIFVISTVVSPIKNITFYDRVDFDFEKYFEDEEFNFYLEQGKEKFGSALNSKKTSEMALAEEIKLLSKCDVKLKIEEDSLYIEGAQEDKKAKIYDYLKNTYSIEAIFVD